MYESLQRDQRESIYGYNIATSYLFFLFLQSNSVVVGDKTQRWMHA